MRIKYLFIQKYLNQNLNLINYQTVKYNIILLLLLYILCTLQLQPYQITMASKQSPSTSNLHRRRTRPYATTTNHCSWQLRCDHNICPFICTVPKYVTDVAKLISASAESRRMFLTEVTRTCLEAAKKDKADSNQMTSSQLGQTPTNTNTTSTRTIFSTSSSSNTATKPVAAVFNTSGTEMKNRIEDGRPNQVVTLFSPVWSS